MVTNYRSNGHWVGLSVCPQHTSVDQSELAILLSQLLPSLLTLFIFTCISYVTFTKDRLELHSMPINHFICFSNNSPCKGLVTTLDDDQKSVFLDYLFKYRSCGANTHIQYCPLDNSWSIDGSYTLIWAFLGLQINDILVLTDDDDVVHLKSRNNRIRPCNRYYKVLQASAWVCN